MVQFYAPAYVLPKHMTGAYRIKRNRRLLLVDQKFASVSCVNVAETRCVPGAGVAELQDGTKESGPQMVQSNTEKFTVGVDCNCNALVMWIWFGGSPDDGCAGGDPDTKYPYASSKLCNTRAVCGGCSSNIEDRMCAVNWRNFVLWLNHRLLSCGDIITVVSDVDALQMVVQYRFTVTIERVGAGVGTKPRSEDTEIIELTSHQMFPYLVDGVLPSPAPAPGLIPQRSVKPAET